MRILHVVPWLAPRYGGPAIAVIDMATEQAARGDHVEIVTTNVDGRDVLDVPVDRPTAWNGPVVTFHGVSPPRRYLTSWTLARDLTRRMGSFDVVHVHCLYRFTDLAAAVVARLRHVPYVIQPHGSLDPWHRARRRRLKDGYHRLIQDPILRGAAGVVVSSQRERAALRRLGYAVPVSVVPHGVRADELRCAAEAQSEDPWPGERLVTFLGRISEKKGLELVVEAFLAAAPAVPDLRLVVAGPDDEGIGARLMPLIAASSLADRITFTGPLGRDEKARLLGRSAAFVLPSADESFGIAVAEALAVGCPVIVSPGVAIHDDVRVAGAGLVVERHPAALAAAMRSVLEPGVGERMGVAGRRLVDERFTMAHAWAGLDALYGAASQRGLGARGTDDGADPGHRPGPPFRCVVCESSLVPAPDGYRCAGCERRYPSVDGIPVLLVDRSAASHDEIDHAHGRAHSRSVIDEHKAAQALHFERSVAEEFEITRPHGAPRLYRFLLNEKLRRALSPLGAQLRGATVLTVCGGSGMDAEYAARAGARVVSTDVSLGAARRARQRARRYGLDITPVVADVERLPFPDASFDLVLVHDGLHHLERPEAALAEMARVSRRWLSITEPSEAVVTRLAVHLGIARHREEAGNRAARLTRATVAGRLEETGFAPIVARRYAMFHPHHPGPAMRILSVGPALPLSRAAWRVANAVLGRFGNKLVVVAERVDVTRSASDGADPGTPAPIHAS